MKTNDVMFGHIVAIITVFIWGTTFISTKLLLVSFSPIEILFFRFTIGFITLLLLKPQRFKTYDFEQELTFAAAGFCGVTLYYLLENIALTYSLASNIGVIAAIAPFFTAVLAHWFLKDEQLLPRFFIGFIVAITGVILVSFNGSVAFELNPFGDFLAVLASIVWALYSILSRKISYYGYNAILATRHIFFYGLLFMTPTLLFFDFRLGIERFYDMNNLFNILYLGFAASALCFITWGLSLKKLGAVKASTYIYAVPVITVITSVLVLQEKITMLAIAGIVLILLGLVISEGRLNFKRKALSPIVCPDK